MNTDEKHHLPPDPAERSSSWESGPKGKDLFENTRDLVQLITPEGVLLEVNPAWKITLERIDDDLSHFLIYNVIHPRDHDMFRRTISEVIAENVPQFIKMTMITKSGREVFVEGTLAPLQANGRPKVLWGIFHDVTRRKQYDELKDEFVGTVSHELRTPLTVVREGTAQLQDGLFGPVSGEQKELLSMVLDNIDRLTRIINDLLDVSRLEAGQIRLKRMLCNIPEMAREVIRSFEGLARQKGLQLQLETTADSIEVYLDHDKFIQILTNLVGNSLKFTHEGHVKISIREFGGGVECRVSDTGRGISGEDLPKVFEKFHQFGRTAGPGIKGTGLGLAICKKLVELHHGKISIESLPMQGTSITMLFPKYTSREIFREHIAQALGRCIEEGGTLSLIVLDIVAFEESQERLGEKHLKEIVTRMEKMINENLRRMADIAIKDKRTILVLLPDTKKENAHIVLGRLCQMLEEYLAAAGGGTRIGIHSSVAVFPEDAGTVDEIIEKIRD
ncbi:MAG: Alkaline phosphatase synthesis sensor protein PhoR [Candidatus Omnitrophica bacterium ADurb.Bin277]|nr:MAG: Alkaline phosphatase synthesis sensor protein PhoR [Candidatus Omnitrophica bacterium ADurb.Bin277]